MTSDLDLHGVWVPLITPFDAAGAVDTKSIEKLCAKYLRAGVAGIVALGTTGEASALEEDEKQLVIDTITRVCADAGSRVIVGTGSNNTAHTIEATAALRGKRAVVAALVVTPYYVRPSEAGIVAHVRAVAEKSPVPVVVYNIPIRTGRGLGAASLIELGRTPNVAGVKQALSALDADTLEVLAALPPGFSVLGGEDTLLFPLMCMGAAGTVSAAAHLCTEQFVAMIDYGLAGKVDDGRALAESLLPVVRSAYVEPNPSIFKAVLHAQGLIATPSVRPPLTDASAAARDACMAADARVAG
jgi:4-hydroxy-tetrahydrodipicolinate synthase